MTVPRELGAYTEPLVQQPEILIVTDEAVVSIRPKMPPTTESEVVTLPLI